MIKVINGTFGSVWVDGEKWLDIDSFDSKVNLNYEDVNMAEDLATYGKLLGYSGEGTITTKKVYSRGAKKVAQALKENRMPDDIKIVGKLADPDSHGAERVSFEHVNFTEFTPLKFEQKTVMKEELPFRFAKFDFIDKIE